MEIWRQSRPLMAIPVLGLPGMGCHRVANGLPVGVRSSTRFREDLLPCRPAEAIEARVPRITPIDPRH